MKGVSSCILVLGKEFLDIYEFFFIYAIMKGVSSCILVLGKEFLDIYEFLDICH